LGLSFAAAAIGVRPVAGLLEVEPTVLASGGDVTTAELSALFHEAYSATIPAYLSQESPINRLFRDTDPYIRPVGRSFEFPVRLA
jgi:hypothetical protein